MLSSYNATKPAPAISGFDHEGNAGSDNSVIGKIVEQHGPAIAHQHFSDGQSHMIVTQHQDGHQHISTGHPNFGHALQHIGVAHQE